MNEAQSLQLNICPKDQNAMPDKRNENVSHDSKTIETASMATDAADGADEIPSNQENQENQFTVNHDQTKMIDNDCTFKVSSQQPVIEIDTQKDDVTIAKTNTAINVDEAQFYHQLACSCPVMSPIQALTSTPVVSSTPADQIKPTRYHSFNMPYKTEMTGKCTN